MIFFFRAARGRVGNRAPTFAKMRTGSTGRPGEGAAGEQVHVEVRNRFAAVGAVVDHEAKAAGEVEF